RPFDRVHPAALAKALEDEAHQHAGRRATYQVTTRQRAGLEYRDVNPAFPHLTIGGVLLLNITGHNTNDVHQLDDVGCQANRGSTADTSVYGHAREFATKFCQGN